MKIPIRKEYVIFDDEGIIFQGKKDNMIEEWNTAMDGETNYISWKGTIYLAEVKDMLNLNSSKRRRKNMNLPKLIGYVGVDSGLIFIGDPSYILDGYKQFPRILGGNYSEFCNKILENDESPKLMSFPFGKDKDDNDGLGVCISSGYGDGMYPVYVEMIDEPLPLGGKRIKSVTIKFIND